MTIIGILHAIKAKFYWRWTLGRIEFKGFLLRFKRPTKICQCTYVIDPVRVFKTCTGCGGKQQHGRFED
jgi:hypothetical protein